MNPGSWVKVHFQLEQDEDGYPPVGAESVWAESGPNEGEYVIANIPFFVPNVTLGDTVAAHEDEEGVLCFDRVIRTSENSLIRIVFFDRTCLDAINQRLESLGCWTEYVGAYNILAVNIPAGVSLKRVQDFLSQEARADRIDYEEPILRQQ